MENYICPECNNEWEWCNCDRELYVIEVYGWYGGQVYCLVSAISLDEADKLAKEKYLNDDLHNMEFPVETWPNCKIEFDGRISSLWFVTW